MAPYNFIATRDDAKKVFTAIITQSVEGQNEQFIAPDLSNVLALVAVSTSGQIVAHIHEEESLKAVDFDTSIESLAKSAQEMSVDFDSDPSYDCGFRTTENARFIEDEVITFAMELNAVA